MTTRLRLANVCISGALALSCSDFFGDAPDPGAYGPVEGGPRSTGNGSNTTGSGGSNNNGTGGSNNNPVSNSTVVATGINVWSLALDDSFVYAASDQGLVRVSKMGGTAMPIGILPQGGPSGIALDAAHVFYVTNSGAVEAIPKEGGSPEDVVPAGDGSGNSAIVLDGDTLYYTVGPYLRSAPVAGGAFKEISTQVQQGNNQPNRLAVDAKNVYFVSVSNGNVGGQQTNISALPKAGGSVQNLGAAKGTIGALAAASGGVSGGGVIFTDVYAFGGTKLDLNVAGVGVPAVTLGSVTFAGSNPDVGSALAIDSTLLHAYFSGSPGLISFDGQIKTIDSTVSPRAIAIDDTDVYFADQNSGGPNPTGPSIKKIKR